MHFVLKFPYSVFSERQTETKFNIHHVTARLRERNIQVTWSQKNERLYNQ